MFNNKSNHCCSTVMFWNVSVLSLKLMKFKNLKYAKHKIKQCFIPGMLLVQPTHCKTDCFHQLAYVLYAMGR